MQCHKLLFFMPAGYALLNKKVFSHFYETFLGLYRIINLPDTVKSTG